MIARQPDKEPAMQTKSMRRAERAATALVNGEAILER